jgi:hypothetical protein
VRGAAVMEVPGTANAEKQFILQNTTDNVATWIPGSSPYQPSRTDLAPAPATGPVVPPRVRIVAAPIEPGTRGR